MKHHFKLVALLLVAALFATIAFGVESDWRTLVGSARAAWRTNPAVALELCDRAIALKTTNASPWLMRAAIEDSQRDYEKALKDLTEALRLEPQLKDAYQLRGIVQFKLSHFRESVQDFDRFLAYVPSQRPYHWQRGISLYYAGDYEAGRKQFELHQTVNSNDVENAVWHFLCVARESGVERARQVMLKPGADARVPMNEIYALFGGKESEEQVMSAAFSRRTDDALFYAHLYLGLYFDVMKETKRAREHIDKAIAIGPSHYMGDVARVQAKWLRH
jgi:lipoprotein NlpI